MKFSKDKLKLAMKEQGDISLRELGRTLKRSYQTINSWTLGDSVPNSDDLANLAVALDKGTSYFYEAEAAASPSAATDAADEASAGPSDS